MILIFDICLSQSWVVADRFHHVDTLQPLELEGSGSGDSQNDIKLPGMGDPVQDASGLMAGSFLRKPGTKQVL